MNGQPLQPLTFTHGCWTLREDPKTLLWEGTDGVTTLHAATSFLLRARIDQLQQPEAPHAL